MRAWGGLQYKVARTLLTAKSGHKARNKHVSAQRDCHLLSKVMMDGTQSRASLSFEHRVVELDWGCTIQE